jgi:hypothetical protein
LTVPLFRTKLLTLVSFFKWRLGYVWNSHTRLPTWLHIWRAYWSKSLSKILAVRQLPWPMDFTNICFSKISIVIILLCCTTDSVPIQVPFLHIL